MLERLTRVLRIRCVFGSDVNVDTSKLVFRVVFQRFAKQFSIGNDHVSIVESIEFGRKQIQSLDGPFEFSAFDVVIYFKRAKNHQHDPRSKVPQGPLECHTNSKTHGSDNRGKAGYIYAKVTQCSNQDHDHNHVLDKVAGESTERFVDLFGYCIANNSSNKRSDQIAND